MPSQTQNLHRVTQHIPSTSYWHPGQYLYLQWARHTQHKLLAIWQISLPTVGKRDTQHNLLASWQVPVPTLGKT